MSKDYRVYNKKTRTVEETIHISFKGKKKDNDQNIQDLEEDMDNLSLNNDSQNQQSLQIATRQINDDSKPPYPQHVSDDIPEDAKETPIKRRFTSVKELRVISQNQIINEPSQRIRARSSFKTVSNMALILEIQLESVNEELQVKVGQMQCKKN